MTQNFSWDEILMNFETVLDEAYLEFNRCKEILVDALDELENSTKDEFIKYFSWKARNEIEDLVKKIPSCERLRDKLGQEVIADSVIKGEVL